MEGDIPHDREWLNYKEAQVVSGYGRTTLWKLVSAEKIPAAKEGRTVRISREGLAEYMWSQVSRPAGGTTLEREKGGSHVTKA